MKSKKDLWKICWRVTRVYYNQINILGGGNMKKETLNSIIDMKMYYISLMDEETLYMLRQAQKTYYAKAREIYSSNLKKKKGD